MKIDYKNTGKINMKIDYKSAYHFIYKKYVL